MSAIVVVGMSIDDANRKPEIQCAADDIGASVAFLQCADSALTDVLTSLADRGTRHITLVGVRLGSSGPGVSWLRRIAADWWGERGAAGARNECLNPGCADPAWPDTCVAPPPRIEVATRLAAALPQIALVARHVSTITGPGAGLVSADWADVPTYRRRVLLCRGPRCSARGAADIAAALNGELRARGLGDDDVLVTITGCQFPCNNAPVVSIEPDDVWYGAVDGPTVRRIVARHLVAGVPLDDHRISRRSDREPEVAANRGSAPCD